MTSTVHFDPTEEWDNLHGPSRPDVHWSTDNVGEAAPGVLTPLSADLWGRIGEKTTRGSLIAMGVLPQSEAGVPDRLEDRYIRVFCGRIALQIELMTLIGDRLPGASGPEIAKSLLGTVPEDIEYRPTKSRYPVIAWKLSRTFLGMPRRLARETPGYHRYWQQSIADLAEADLVHARRILREATSQFEAALLLQSTAVSGHANLMFQLLAGVIQAAGAGDLGVLSGAGGAEMAVITDIWKASRGELTVEQVIREHGFHGPLEGEISSTVWREDPAPLARLITEYAGRDDPRRHEAEMNARLPAAQADVLGALPPTKRPWAKLVLKMAAHRVPLRGVAKRSFLEGLDVIRACARRIGTALAADGALEVAEDAFYLTTDELLTLPANARDLVARRRERRAAYQRVALPGAWKGLPGPVEIEVSSADAARVERVTGIGASGGVAEGRARVVTDPSFAEVEPDEILVAATTDPSWASIMYVSSALVMDMGGPISHAAVVARELGIPCVVNTRTGTRDIRTGDRVRVDGGTGTIEILEPAAS